MKKKMVSRKKFIFSIVISLLIWSPTVNLLSFILIALIYTLTNNSTLAKFMWYAMWILNSALIILLCYINNKNKIVSKNELDKTKKDILIIFYIFMGLSTFNLMNLIKDSMIVWIPILILQMFLITLINGIMFRRCIYYEKK